MRRDLIGNAIKPVPDIPPRDDGCRLADEDEERGLEGVLGVLVALESAVTDAPHHPGVSPHDGGKSRLVVPLDETGKQFTVRLLITVAR
jgi:hypothetical protein